MAKPRKRKPNERGRHLAKRTLFQHEEDLAFIAEHFLRGLNHRQITDKLNAHRTGLYSLTPRAIGLDVAVLHERWEADHTLETVEKVKFRALQRIDRIEAKMWEYIDRSEGYTTEMQESMEERDLQGATGTRGTVTKTNKTTKHRLANPSWMATIQWCNDRRLEIWGIIGKNAGMVVNVGAGAGQVINQAPTINLVLQVKTGQGIENGVDAKTLLDFPRYVELGNTLVASQPVDGVAIIPRAAR